MEKETTFEPPICSICGGRTLYDNSGEDKNEMILVDKDTYAHRKCAENQNWKVRDYFKK